TATTRPGPVWRPFLGAGREAVRVCAGPLASWARPADRGPAPPTTAGSPVCSLYSALLPPAALAPGRAHPGARPIGPEVAQRGCGPQGGAVLPVVAAAPSPPDRPGLPGSRLPFAAPQSGRCRGRQLAASAAWDRRVPRAAGADSGRVPLAENPE